MGCLRREDLRPVVSALVRQLTDGLRGFSHVDTDGDAPRWSDASGRTTAQRQPVINAIELALSMPDRPLGRDTHPATDQHSEQQAERN